MYMRDLRDVREIRELRTQLPRKFYSKRKNVLEILSEEDFKKKYRFSKDRVRTIIEILHDDIKPVSSKGGSISIELQICIALRYFAKGSYQQDIECQLYSKQLSKQRLIHYPVVGGEDTHVAEFPHMVALGFGKKNKIQWLCGGSLISTKYVLTAAHCMFRKELGLVSWAKLGEIRLSEKSPTFKISKRIPHPNYRWPSLYNDIALVLLESIINFSSFIKPGCLSRSPRLEGAELIATGWGLTQFIGQPSDVLQKVELELFSYKKCQNTFMYLIGSRYLVNGISQDSQLCAGSKDNERDTCQGDSGGPLQSYMSDVELFSIEGITSFGKGCGNANVPAVYTKVKYFVPWIESIVWPNDI